MVVERVPFQVEVFMRVPMRLNLGLVRGDHYGKRRGIKGDGPNFRSNRKRHCDKEQQYATKQVDWVPPSLHAASRRLGAPGSGALAISLKAIVQSYESKIE